MVTTRDKAGQLEHVRFQLPKATTTFRTGRHRHIMRTGNMDRGRCTSSHAGWIYSSRKAQGRQYSRGISHIRKKTHENRIIQYKRIWDTYQINTTE
jgi:hypothetical protein